MSDQCNMSFLKGKWQAEKIAEAEITKSTNESQKLEKNWSGWYPYLCLIHALSDNNEVKYAYLSCHNIPCGRLTIENWNHDDQELSVWQMMTNYWNDQNFTPET